MASVYRAFQRTAHEKPVIFWSLLIGVSGPVMVMVVPPTRRYFGYVAPERVPTSYPLPQRARRPVTGYEDS